MDINYICTKKRKDFGKPCTFTDFGSNVILEIDPDPNLREQFFMSPTVDRIVDNSTKMCAHEVNTVTYPTESRGMNHMEGGWPASVDSADEESIARFRKKVEKDKSYVNAVKSLADFLETFIMENNSIDIYEEYFDGEKIKPDLDTSIRSVITFKDFSTSCRSIVDLSWDKDSIKFAAAYALRQSNGYTVVDPCIDCYVWDIHNSINPICVLKPEVQMSIVEFSPTSLDLILSGYESGQVALWDIRSIGRPEQLSTIMSSHSEKVTGIKWLHGKNDTSFFSASKDGQIMSWDMRNLSKPTESLLLDPEKGDIPDLDRIYTVSCVEYDITVPESFMVGTQQGIVLSFNRRFKEVKDKIPSQYNCENGPLLAVERNAYFPQLFTSCDAWSIKLWSDAATDMPILNMVSEDGYFTDMAWSSTRASTLYATKTTGVLEVWDIPGKNKNALLSTRLDREALLSVAATEAGDHVICGSLSGSVQLVTVPEYLRTCSELEIDLVKDCLRNNEEIVGGKPRSERNIDIDTECSEKGTDEDWWDPPEKGEDLREEYKILFKDFPKKEEE